MDIFIVERSAAIRERLAFFAERFADTRIAGCADSETAAVEAILAHCPDAAIVDLHLASGRGIDCVRRLRSAGIDIPIVIMTDEISPVSHRRGIESGADGFFDKRSQYVRAFHLLRSLAATRRTRLSGVTA